MRFLVTPLSSRILKFIFFHFNVNSPSDLVILILGTQMVESVPGSLFKSCFYFILLYFILFLAVLGLRCCVQAFSSCGERGLLFVVVRRLLIAVAFLVAECGLQ